ncbi:MAG: O-antigen polysaccharide polymerase Wzy, partial [Pseudomonadota bacterium]
MSTTTQTMMRAHVAQRASTMWIWVLIAASGFLALMSGYQLMLNDSLSESWPAQISVLLILWGLLYTFATKKLFGTIYLFGSAYLLGLVIFHLGQVMYHGLGIEYFKHYTSGSFAIWLQRASWASLLSVACFGLGIAFSVRRRPAPASTLPPEVIARNHRATLAGAYWLGVGFLMAAIAGLGLTFMTVGNIFAFSRTEYFGGLGDTRGFGLFLLAAPSAAVLMVVGARKRSQLIMSFLIAAFIGGMLMLLGYRSSALFSGLVGAVVWVKVGRKIPMVTAVVAILVVLTAIPTVRVLRQMGAAEDISSEKIKEAYEASSSREVILEIGGTNGILAHVLQWVPKEESFWYGSSYGWAVSNAVPNLGLNISQAVQDQNKVGDSLDQLRGGNPSRWYIFKVNRWKFDRGQGAGFSTIAEPYLNFGWAGVIVF